MSTIRYVSAFLLTEILTVQDFQIIRQAVMS